MHLQDRWKRIIDELNTDRVTSVDELTERLGVSPATIRRDLNELHELGHLLRVRGGAMRAEGTVYSGRGDERRSGLTGQSAFADSVITNAGAKRAIAKMALSYITPGLSMIIDGGTTTFMMASMMADEAYHVLTTSVPILQCLFERPRIKVTVPGGELFRDQGIILNPYEDGILQHFAAQRMFIGCQALTKNGLMQTDTLLVQSERRLMERAGEVIVLADSSKIDAQASLSVCPLKDIDVLITDENIDPSAVRWLNAHDIEVRIARIHEDAAAA
ncbi:DeoR/GlpR family DNA-binding transcription regulator [Asticcacaulis sp. EMRT-3]|uniref:DeoR/GlpR family DNA-binding transcription regulator n=1 Tax=Asticcacaulis sp. EMRT-3 TaxID=3040349 RepID=UPI0024AE9E6E|nr:DeoR/GlpR family DNA-binding transcription regulator [Asticcacaulis sp. EMRT-3]MDI7776420.1 DeoR/GlpR family DNA-binding transcription regulator [Asticcacaulis sp. EMRT-3]